MDRLEFIYTINPEWSNQIVSFMCDYPEFQPYMNRAPLTPICTIPYKNVHTVFQAVLYYVCASGVRFSYALEQWDIIYPCILETKTWTEIVQNVSRLKDDARIQKKKREIYHNICVLMDSHSITHIHLQNNPELISMFRTQVSGIGDGCVAWIYRYFTLRDDCVEYTDFCFRKGFRVIYGADKDTTSFRKKRAKEWTEKKVGRIANLMVLSCC